MNQLEKILYNISLPEDICHIIYEERDEINYGQCQTAAKVKGIGAINRYNEFRKLKCPDMDYVCPFKSGKFI